MLTSDIKVWVLILEMEKRSINNEAIHNTAVCLYGDIIRNTKMLGVYIFTTKTNTEVWKTADIKQFFHASILKRDSADQCLPELLTTKNHSWANLGQRIGK